MKYGLGGSLSHIAVPAMEITMLIRRSKKVPMRALRALPKRVEMAKERDIAVLIQTRRTMMMGPGLMLMISRRKPAAMSRKMHIESVAERKKSR